jgi:hypothetical protein
MFLKLSIIIIIINIIITLLDLVYRMAVLANFFLALCSVALHSTGSFHRKLKDTKECEVRMNEIEICIRRQEAVRLEATVRWMPGKVGEGR